MGKLTAAQRNLRHARRDSRSLAERIPREIAGWRKRGHDLPAWAWREIRQAAIVIARLGHLARPDLRMEGRNLHDIYRDACRAEVMAPIWHANTFSISSDQSIARWLTITERRSTDPCGG